MRRVLDKDNDAFVLNVIRLIGCLFRFCLKLHATVVSATYSIKFRETGSFSIPKVKGFGKRSFVYNGCVLWNGLPSSIRNLQRDQQFKIAVKNHFLDSINF